jgi:hypothetical protein
MREIRIGKREGGTERERQMLNAVPCNSTIHGCTPREATTLPVINLSVSKQLIMYSNAVSNF